MSTQMELPNDPVAYWAGRINQAWGRSRDGFFECGRLLVEAKKDLTEKHGHGHWLSLIGSRQAAGALSFGYRAANMLMRIVADPILPQLHHDALLPADYNTLYLLERLHHRFP